MLENIEWTRRFVAPLREKLADASKRVTFLLQEIGVECVRAANVLFFVCIDLPQHLPDELNGKQNSKSSLL